MPADISTFDYKVQARGYRVTGDAATGYRAVVPYLLPWGQAFNFADEIMGLSSASTVGAITYGAPYRFPDAVANLYAQSFEIEPVGASGATAADANHGLAPGEFFTHAIVRVTFQTPSFAQQAAEQPLHQLDPSNPLTVCRQSVRAAGKMETLKAGHYVYDSDGKKVDGDFAVPTCESVLELEFPQIPYLPWQLVRPYINKINSAAVLGVGIGELLFEGMTTRVEATTQGMSQMIVLSLAVTPTPGITWNHLPRPDGTPALVKRAGSSDRIFQSADFLDIFDTLDRTEV